MTLEGLMVPTWIGWLIGILFIKPPWDLNITKLSVRIYPIILTIISLTVWFDFLIHVDVPNPEGNSVRRIVTIILTWAVVLCKFFLRTVLCIKGKSLAEFCQRLYNHTSFLLNEFGLKIPISLFDKFLMLITLCLEFSSFCLAIGSIAARRQYLIDSWFGFLFDWQYTILLSVFGILPNFILLYITFSIILTTTKYILYIWNDFCYHVESYIKFSSSSTTTASTSNCNLPKSYFGVYESEFLQSSRIFIASRNSKLSSFLAANHHHCSNQNNNWIEFEQLLRRFDELTNIFKIYDDIIGPLLFGVVIINIFVLLQRTNDIFTWLTDYRLVVSHSVALLSQIIQIIVVVIYLGQLTKSNILEQKASLRKSLTLNYSSSKQNLNKQYLKLFLQLIDNWEWEMNGIRFFVISRSFMTAVLFLLVSYTVIVFQIQLAEQ